MRNLVKFKKDIQELLIKEYNGRLIYPEEVKQITEQNLKSFPINQFFDYYIFYIKHMKYILGFDISYDMVIFYSDGCCSEGFYQVSSFDMKFIEIEKIDLMQKKKEALDKFIEWFKKKYAENNNQYK